MDHTVRLASSLAILVLLVPTPLNAQQQASTISVAITAAPYVAPPVPDEEAASISLSTSASVTNPLVTMLDPAGDESHCILPCTLRSRVGVARIEGARLAVDVELPAAGVTYDVQLSPGPSGDDFALVGALIAGGGVALGLGAWGLATTNDSEVVTLSAIGVGYGGLTVVVMVPFLFWMLATLDGTASITGYRRGLTAGLVLTERGPAIAF